jgi:alpha-beta hydrolase superfamily lysophospholipase
VRRDDVVLHAGVERRAFYLGEGDRAFFAWEHRAPGAGPATLAAVICGPVGHEYTRAHRTLRHLADRLALAGVPAIRFDYHGIGDSPGTDLDADRLERWQQDIRAASDHAQALTGCGRVCLIGVRLGATLAALASATRPVERMVLWNPCVKGRRYVRELQAIAQSAAQVADDGSAALESAGFVMSAQTVANLSALDLTQVRLQAREVLFVGRDDLAVDDSLSAHLASRGIAHDCARLPGWAAMMAEHQFTVVPDEALRYIVEWVGKPSFARHWSTDGSVATASAAPRATGQLSLPDIEESICRFGPGAGLFGILSRGSADPAAPVIVMFNAGAVHHVGPSRIYVTLARSLAAMGFACLRFDLQGIGDSVLRSPGRENHPYPQSASADAGAALEYLGHEHGYTRFIALGLCSGAHTAFHSALAPGQAIDEVILINPLTFYFREGMSLATVNDFADAQAYRRSMRDPSRWLKLLRGEVNLVRLLEVAMSHPRTLARSYLDAACEAVAPSRAPQLSQDLRRLFEMKRRVMMLVAEGDPGRDILMAGAKLTATRALRSGQMRLETIPGGDHTFSQSAPRAALLRTLAEHLAPRGQGQRAG